MGFGVDDTISTANDTKQQASCSQIVIGAAWDVADADAPPCSKAPASIIVDLCRPRRDIYSIPATSVSPKSARTMPSSNEPPESHGKKRIFLNAFDMFTVGHLSFGQWRNPEDKSATKRRDLSYWTNLAKLLEEGDINALFLADTLGQYDVYKGSARPGIRTGAQYPMGDPAIVSIRNVSLGKL